MDVNSVITGNYSKNADYSLYLVTDRSLSKGRATREIVEAAVYGGVTCVQLREKNCSTREFINEALSIRDFLKDRNVPLIINDRIDVAMAVRADGVHLGQNDMPLETAREITGNKMIIGISAESAEDAVNAEKNGADYIGISPVFSTPTKTDTAPALGLQGIREMRNAVNIPLVGIGGLNKKNTAEVIRHGADGIAVVSAIVSAENPEKAAEELKKIINPAKRGTNNVF